MNGCPARNEVQVEEALPKQSKENTDFMGHDWLARPHLLTQAKRGEED